METPYCNSFENCTASIKPNTKRNMKSLFTAVLIATCSFLSGQDFAALNTSWKYRSWDISPYGSIYEGRVNSDTLLQGRYCTIMTLFVQNEKVSGSEIIFYEEAQRIYFFERDTFLLLYDFSDNLKVGDIIEYHLPENVNHYAIDSGGENEITNPYYLGITGIDSVQTEEGEFLRRFHFDYSISSTFYDCNYIPQIIEGVGTIPIFMVSPCVFLPSGFGPYFRCYESPTKTYKEIEMCDPSTSIQSVVDPIPLKFFPNPFASDYQIDVQEEVDRIQLVNNLGQYLFDVSSDSDELSTLSSGTYYLRVHHKNNIYIQRIVKL